MWTCSLAHSDSTLTSSKKNSKRLSSNYNLTGEFHKITLVPLLAWRHLRIPPKLYLSKMSPKNITENIYKYIILFLNISIKNCWQWNKILTLLCLVETSHLFLLSFVIKTFFCFEKYPYVAFVFVCLFVCLFVCKF